MNLFTSTSDKGTHQASSEIEFDYRHTLTRLRDILEEDLKANGNDDGTNRHKLDNQRRA